MLVTIVYRNVAGETVGYLSRNWLMAKRRENALAFDDNTMGINGLIRKAHRLLEGPHPLDHHGQLTVGTEPAWPIGWELDGTICK